jgi:hypothetical protein
MRAPVLAVGLAAVVLGLAACGSGSAVRTIKPSPTSSSASTRLVPTAQEASQEATRGCLAVLAVSDIISEAADANSMSPLENRETGPSSSWTYLTDMTDLASIPKYRQLSSDVSAFVQGANSSEASGNLDRVENALTAVIKDCGSLGYATSPAPVPATTTAPPTTTAATVPPTTAPPVVTAPAPTAATTPYGGPGDSTNPPTYEWPGGSTNPCNGPNWAQFGDCVPGGGTNGGLG